MFKGFRGAAKAMASQVRLEGMIGHVLRRRIVKTEQQLIPESLRHWDFATPISAATPMILQQGQATTQVFTN